MKIKDNQKPKEGNESDQKNFFFDKQHLKNDINETKTAFDSGRKKHNKNNIINN